MVTDLLLIVTCVKTWLIRTSSDFKYSMLLAKDCLKGLHV